MPVAPTVASLTNSSNSSLSIDSKVRLKFENYEFYSKSYNNVE